MDTDADQTTEPQLLIRPVGVEDRADLERIRQAAGMRVATVTTGGDPKHAAAHRAYEKAGFDVQIPSVWLCRKL